MLVTFDRGFVVDSMFGFGEPLLDAAQPAAGPVVTVLVVDDPIRGAAGLLRAGRCPPLVSTSPYLTAWLACGIMPASATTVRSVSWWAAIDAQDGQRLLDYVYGCCG